MITNTHSVGVVRDAGDPMACGARPGGCDRILLVAARGRRTLGWVR